MVASLQQASKKISERTQAILIGCECESITNLYERIHNVWDAFSLPCVVEGLCMPELNCSAICLSTFEFRLPSVTWLRRCTFFHAICSFLQLCFPAPFTASAMNWHGQASSSPSYGMVHATERSQRAVSLSEMTTSTVFSTQWSIYCFHIKNLTSSASSHWRLNRLQAISIWLVTLKNYLPLSTTSLK